MQRYVLTTDCGIPSLFLCSSRTGAGKGGPLLRASTRQVEEITECPTAPASTIYPVGSTRATLPAFQLAPGRLKCSALLTEEPVK